MPLTTPQTYYLHISIEGCSGMHPLRLRLPAHLNVFALVTPYETLCIRFGRKYVFRISRWNTSSDLVERTFLKNRGLPIQHAAPLKLAGIMGGELIRYVKDYTIRKFV